MEDKYTLNKMQTVTIEELVEICLSHMDCKDCEFSVFCNKNGLDQYLNKPYHWMLED